MKSPATSRQVEYELAENRLLRLSNAKGRRIECMSGLAWITAYGEACDVTLRPGEVFVIPNQGLTLVEAIGHGRIRVEPPAPIGWVWRRKVMRQAQAWSSEALTALRQSLRSGRASCTDLPK